MKRIINVFFVRREEIEEKDKNALIATLLAFFFGYFGFHRFYLGRKLSGVLFVAFTILSLFKGDGIIFFLLFVLSLIEGLIYLFYALSKLYLELRFLMKSFIENLRQKHFQIKKNVVERNIDLKNKRKRSSIKRQDNHQFEEIRNDDKIIKIFESEPPCEEKKDDEVDFVDVSKIEVSTVEWDEGFKRPQDQSWVDKLDYPYERGTMGLSQIKKETLKMYSAFCELVDEMLLEQGKSLDGEVRRIKNMNIYYDNLLYTLYCISKGIVTEEYAGHLYYDYHLSYQILEEHLGKEIKERIVEEAQILRQVLPPADEEVRDYFNLTESGLTWVWWDEDGTLRENKDFSTEEINILKMTPSRNTLAWNYSLMREQILLLYLSLWHVIMDSLNQETWWDEDMAQAMQRLVLGKTPYYEMDLYRKLSSSLLKIAENTVRDLIPNMRLLNTESEKSIIEKIFPSELVKLLEEHLEYFKTRSDKETVQSMLVEMIDERPENWRLKLDLLLFVNASESIPYFVEYFSDKFSVDIMKEILRRCEDSDKRLLALSILALKEDLNRNNYAELKQFIHSWNWQKFEELINESQEPSTSFFNKVLLMQKPIRRKLAIDFEKIEASKKELQETVAVVEEFIGVQEDEDLYQKDENVDVRIIEEEVIERNCLEYQEFLKLLLEREHLPIDEGQKIALKEGTLLNAFISDVNRELYDYVQDQTIIIEEGLIRIDKFYIETVEELIESEE